MTAPLAVAIAAVALLGPAPAEARAQGSAEPPVTAPSRVTGATIARIVDPVVARRRLDSPRPSVRLSAQTAWSGQPQHLLVLDSAMRRGIHWLKVRLASRPTPSSAWIQRGRVRLSTTRYWVEIRRGRRLVTVFRSGRRIRRFRAVVGARSTPTPLGLAAIYERNRQPSAGGFLGPWALPLTAMSPVLENYGGGPGRIGLHGRGGASFADPLGSARSHGCIRVNNGHISWMATRLPPGAPVHIRR